jgi:hypothetical protein
MGNWTKESAEKENFRNLFNENMKQFQNKLEVINKICGIYWNCFETIVHGQPTHGPCLEFGRAIFHDCTFILYYILDIYNLFYFVCVCIYFIYLFIYLFNA